MSEESSVEPEWRYEGHEVYEDHFLGFTGVSIIWLAIAVWVSNWTISPQDYLGCGYGTNGAYCQIVSTPGYLDPNRLIVFMVLLGIYLLICATLVRVTEHWSQVKP